VATDIASPAGLAQRPSVPDQPTPSFPVTFLRRPHKCYVLPTMLLFHMVSYNKAVTLLFSHKSLNARAGMLHMRVTRFQLSAELSAIMERAEGELQAFGNFTCDTDALVATAGKALFAIRRRGALLSVCDPALQCKLFDTLVLPGRRHTTLFWTQLPVSHEELFKDAAI